jgi:hypothetical protein
MKRTSQAFIAVAVLVGGAGFLFLKPDRSTGAVYILALVSAIAAVIAVSETIVGRPDLVIEYRASESKDHPGTPEVRVVVVSRNRHAAHNVEARFDTLGASLWNESGNSPSDIDQSLSPPRFLSYGRVLHGKTEWCIALLTWGSGYRPLPNSKASWAVSATRMGEVRGTATI